VFALLDFLCDNVLTIKISVDLIVIFHVSNVVNLTDEEIIYNVDFEFLLLSNRCCNWRRNPRAVVN